MDLRDFDDFDPQAVLGMMQKQKRKQQAEHSLHSFLSQAWHVLEGDPFVSSWHLVMLCEVMESVFRGETPKLLMNVPPRTGKSWLVSIAFPAWVWLHAPHKRFIYCSYTREMALDSARKCLMLVSSPWYQGLWGERVMLDKRQNSKSHFALTAGGERRCISVLSHFTGFGGDFMIADDPNDTKNRESAKITEQIEDFWCNRWQSRQNSKHSAMITIQQRISEKDVTALILRGQTAPLWTKVILPMEYESSRKGMIRVGDREWQDPRTEEGQLLCPQRLSQQLVDERRKTMNPYAYAGQYQQRPAPQEGGLFRKQSFRIWARNDLPLFETVFCSVDTALETKEESSYSACTTWGVFKHNGISQVMLLSLFKGKVRFKDLAERMRLMFVDYRDTGRERLRPESGYTPDFFLIEKATLGKPLGDHLRDMGITVRYFIPGNRHQGTYGTNKIDRARSCEIFLGAPEHDDRGIVWLRGQEEGNLDRLYASSKQFLEDALVFPNGASQDVVDTMSQALLYLHHQGKIRNSADALRIFKEENQIYRERKR